MDNKNPFRKFVIDLFGHQILTFAAWLESRETEKVANAIYERAPITPDQAVQVAKAVVQDRTIRRDHLDFIVKMRTAPLNTDEHEEYFENAMRVAQVMSSVANKVVADKVARKNTRITV